MKSAFVTLNEANVKYQQFYVSSVRGLFFPTGKHENTVFDIDIGSGPPIQTTIRPVYLYFQNRSWMKAFFEAHALQVGDRLVFTRTAPQSFRLDVRKAQARHVGSNAFD